MQMRTTSREKVTTIADEYVFDNAGDLAKSRFCDLSQLYDKNTIRHIEDIGIDEGWSCLEVGGGGGSIAKWLCKRVGATGQVLATDINPTFLQTLSLPNLEVRRHDIRVEPLPAREFDLVHVRLVLMHLPEPDDALERLVTALKPGGWIVLEEFDALTLLPEPANYPGEISLKVMPALREVMTARGVDLRFGRLLPQKLHVLGLLNVGVEASATIWRAGSAGIRMLKLSCEELRESIIETGLMSPTEFEDDMNALDQPDFSWPSTMLWTAWGQLL